MYFRGKNTLLGDKPRPQILLLETPLEKGFVEEDEV